MIIPEYPKDSDITILNADYHDTERRPDGSWATDFINIIYKDNQTGEKKHKIIESPDYVYYMLPSDPGYNKFFAKKEEVRAVVCKYNGILRSIAENTGNMDFFTANKQARNNAANKQLHTINTVLGSDMHCEDHYRFIFDRQYKNQVCNITKAFLDIETDIISLPPGKFVEPGQCPINAVTLIDYSIGRTVYTFLLRNDKNPQIKQFEEECNNGIQDELNQFVIEHVGGIEKAKKYKVDDFKFRQFFFDEEDEINMIRSIFLLLHTIRPDFCLAWNMAFDIPYIIERCRKLGYDPADILSDPTYEKRYASYFIDTNHGVEYEARGDKCQIAGDVVFLDELIHFASRRKGQAAFPNFRLDTAGELIAGVNKLDYSHICKHIKFLPYKNYKTFVFYNIFDTIVQACIEAKVNDIDYIFTKCLANNTRYDKGHRQSYYLTNRIIKEFRKAGYIFGNNTNKYNPKKEEFEGAMVNDPTHNSNELKMRNEMGTIFNVLKNLDDFDYKSLYPSIARENNMAPNTILFKVFIDTQVHGKENYVNNPLYDRGGAMLEDLAADNIIEFAHRWLGLPDIKGLIACMEEEFRSAGVSGSLIAVNYEPIFDFRPIEIEVGTDTSVFAFDFVEDKTLNIEPVKRIDIKEYLATADNRDVA